LGKGGLEQFTIDLLKATNGILEFVQSIGGLKTILVALIGVLVTVKLDSFVLTLAKLINGLGLAKNAIVTLATNFIPFVNTLKYAQSEGVGLVGVLTELGVSAKALATGGVALLMTAITAVVAISEKHAQAVRESRLEEEQARQAAVESTTAYEEQAKAIEDAKNKIETEDLSRAQLNNTLSENIK
jgi:hypothetical protein